MTSVTTGLICAILLAIMALIFIGFRVRSYFLNRNTTKTQSLEKDHAGEEVQVQLAHLENNGNHSQPAVSQSPEISLTAPAALPDQDEVDPKEADSTTRLSKEIIAELKNLPPNQVESENLKYKGKKVEWTLYFSSLMLKGETNVEVSLLNANNEYPMVSFLVDLAKNPEVGQLRQGMEVNVKGEIAQIFSNYIILKSVELSLTPPIDL